MHHGRATIRAADLLAVYLIVGLCLSATVSGRELRLKDVAEQHYEQLLQLSAEQSERASGNGHYVETRAFVMAILLSLLGMFMFTDLVARL